MSENAVQKSSKSKPRASNEATEMDVYLRSRFTLTVSGYMNETFERDRNIWISQDIKDLVLFFYTKPVIENIKYDDIIKDILYCSVNEIPIFAVKLNLILNKYIKYMKKNGNENKTAQKILDVIDEYVQTKQQMNFMIHMLLQSAIKYNKHVKILSMFQTYLPKMKLLSQNQWISNENDISKTFTKMVIQQTEQLFKEHCIKHKQCTINNDVISMIAELYNVDFIKKGLVFKGICNALLPPQNMNVDAIDLKTLCVLFKHCGQKLDNESPKHFDKYLVKLSNQANKFNFQTQQLVEKIKWMRESNWSYDKKDWQDWNREFKKNARKRYNMMSENKHFFDHNSNHYHVSDIIHKGCLYIHSKVLNDYKKKWVKLTNDSKLLIFKKNSKLNDKNNHLSSIDLNLFNKIEITDKKTFEFEIRSSSTHKTERFRTSSMYAMQKWLNHIVESNRSIQTVKQKKRKKKKKKKKKKSKKNETKEIAVSEATKERWKNKGFWWKEQ